MKMRPEGLVITRLAGLAAYNVFCITGDDKARKTAEDRVALTLSWQDPDEGWYQEYEGQTS